jgi:hypothetical protein
MKILAALVAGYVFGARTGGKDLDQLTRSLKALVETDEFGDVIAAGRSHVGAALRDLAAIVDGERRPPEASGDLVAKVRQLVGHD